MRLSTYRLGFVALLMAAGALSTHRASAQLEPIVVGGNDNAENAGPSACERDFGSDSLGRWFGQIIRPLCERGDADSLLAAYLLSLPGFAAGGQADHRLLQRAYTLGKPSPKLLWLVATQTDCASPIPGCKAALTAVKAAQALTATDPENAMAWFALARAKDQALADPGEVDAALDRAAKAARVHDYTFDLTKIAAQASGSVPVPAEVDATQSKGTRWLLVYTTTNTSELFAEWVGKNCTFMFDEGDPNRKAACNAAKEQFKKGDSLLTLSGDSQATAAMQAALKHPPGMSDRVFDDAMLSSIAASSSEREWYAKTALTLQSPQ